MGAAQIIVIVLCALHVGGNLAADGKPRNTNFSFWQALGRVAIWIALLWWGGFFGSAA